MGRLSVKLHLGLKYRFGFKISIKRNKRKKQSQSEKERRTACISTLEKDCLGPNKPYIGQFWPLDSVIADPSERTGPSFAILILGEEEMDINHEENCDKERQQEKAAKEISPQLPGLIITSTEDNYSPKDFITDEGGDAGCSNCCEGYKSGSFSRKLLAFNEILHRERSPKHGMQKKHHFRSSTDIPLTSEEIAALEVDINKPLDIQAIIRNKKVLDNIFYVTFSYVLGFSVHVQYETYVFLCNVLTITVQVNLTIATLNVGKLN